MRLIASDFTGLFPGLLLFGVVVISLVLLVAGLACAATKKFRASAALSGWSAGLSVLSGLAMLMASKGDPDGWLFFGIPALTAICSVLCFRASARRC